MTATPSIDLSGWMNEHLEQASPDLLRAMLSYVREALMSAEADAICDAPYGVRSSEREHPQRLPAPGLGYPRGHHRRRDPEAAAWQCISRTGCWNAVAEPRPR